MLLGCSVGVAQFKMAATASPPLEYTKKVIVVGDVGVGKTSFIARVTEGRFISDHKTTIGGL